MPTIPEYHGFIPSVDMPNSLTFHFLLSSSLAEEFNLYIPRLYLFIEEFKNKHYGVLKTTPEHWLCNQIGPDLFPLSDSSSIKGC